MALPYNPLLNLAGDQKATKICSDWFRLVGLETNHVPGYVWNIDRK